MMSSIVVAEHRGVVGPGRDNPAWLRDPADLRVEPLQVEPVDRGCHRHQIHGAALDARILGLGDPVGDPRIARGLVDHLLALVGGYDPFEVPRQVRRRLTVTRRAVPGDLA